jgi:hypothetical protein
MKGYPLKLRLKAPASDLRYQPERKRSRLLLLLSSKRR